MKVRRARIVEGPLAGAIVTLTPDLIAACNDRQWDSARAERLLRETLARVGAACRPEWRARYHAEYSGWLVPEARIEAAALVRDMLEFVRALVAYEHHAQQRFEAWAEEGAQW